MRRGQLYLSQAARVWQCKGALDLPRELNSQATVACAKRQQIPGVTGGGGRVALSTRMPDRTLSLAWVRVQQLLTKLNKLAQKPVRMSIRFFPFTIYF